MGIEILNLSKVEGWEAKLVTDVSTGIKPSLESTILFLRKRMNELGKSEGLDKHNITFMHDYALFELPSGPKSRLEIDVPTRFRIIGYARKFEKEVRDAVEDVISVSKARRLGEADLSDNKSRLEIECREHAKEFKGALEMWKIRFGEAKSYSELLGQTIMLHNDLRAITKGLSQHLKYVANKDVIRD